MPKLMTAVETGSDSDRYRLGAFYPRLPEKTLLGSREKRKNTLEHFHAMLSHVWMGEVARAFLGRRSRERRTYRLGSLSDASGITENALMRFRSSASGLRLWHRKALRSLSTDSVRVSVRWESGLLKETRPSEESILFSQLVKQWNEERGITSSLSKMFMCPSYKKIIKMGGKAVPLILAQLVREGDDPDHWYAALKAITGEDPVPEDAYGDTVQIAKVWLSWAEERNVQYLGEFRTAKPQLSK